MKSSPCLLPLLWMTCLASLLPLRATAAETNDFPVLERKLSLDSHCRYFLLGQSTNSVTPTNGLGLILILPGGDGGEAFLPFCKEMKRWGLPADFIAAQLIAPKWSETQELVWPTAFFKEKGMAHSTEEFIEAVIDDVQKVCKIDARYIFTLSWSSGGPAAYVAALSNKRVTGSFVAMSVFKPELMPPLAAAKGRSFYLYHSPDDQICSFFFAESAKQLLIKNGAAVELKTYPGGHGWRPFTYYFDAVKTGVEWLRSQKTGDARVHQKLPAGENRPDRPRDGVEKPAR